jgi:hypothetical protein
LRALSESSSARRLGSASALNTSSMPALVPGLPPVDMQSFGCL